MPGIELPALYVDNVASIVATDRPLLTNRDPGPDEIGVPLEWFVALEILDPGTDGIDRQATKVWVDGVLAFDGEAASEVQPSFGGARAMVVESSDTLRIVLDPEEPFVSEAIVEVHVVSATVGGSHALDETYSFMAEDRTAPKLVAAQAIGQRTVRLGFDEDVVVVDPSGFEITPASLPAVPLAPISAVAAGTAVTVTLDTEMTPDVKYKARVFGVADVHGNPALPPHDVVQFTGFRPSRSANRRFDLWEMLPVYNRRSDVTGDLRRFISCLQEVTDLLLTEVDRYPDIFDLERAPEPFLDLILRDLGNPFPFDLDVLGKRRLASVLVEMYRQKGTAIGIENAIRFFLGIDITAVVPFTGTTLVLGESLLGVDWELGPSDQFARYAFSVEVGIPLTEVQRQQIRAIVRYMKPAHTHFIDLIEPIPPIDYDHWELGISELGVTSILH